MTGATTDDRLLDDALVEQFRRDGFVVVPGLFEDGELDRYAEVVTAAVLDRTRDDATPLEDKSRYQQSFVQCMNLWEDHPEVAPLTFHPRLGRAAAELLGVAAVRLWHDQALYKQPGGRPTDPHQDHPYWPMRETATLTAWIPFEGSTAAAGAMSFLPGTHAVGLRRFVNIFFGEPEDILADPEVQGIEPVLVELPKGSVTFHHGLTVHLAGANATDRARAVHTIIYFADGNTRGYPVPHFSVDRYDVQVGERIDSEATPIVWPRPDGDRPAPPSVPIAIPSAVVANSGALPRRSS
jgi:ectoine hydroxylase-related dioxygenase (phytanoyl-CoA dioxygenase family)